MATQDEYVRTALRVPRDLHERLHEAARTQGHSFNAEIIRRLEYAFQHPPAVWIAGLAKEESDLKEKAAERDELRAAILRIESRLAELDTPTLHVTVRGKPMTLMRRADGQGYEVAPASAAPAKKPRARR